MLDYSQLSHVGRSRDRPDVSEPNQSSCHAGGIKDKVTTRE